MTDFQSKLNAALEAGRQAEKPKGASITAIASRLMDAGVRDEAEIIRTVLEEKGDAPEWLSEVPDHDLMVILKRWGSVKHGMALWRKAQKAGG